MRVSGSGCIAELFLFFSPKNSISYTATVTIGKRPNFCIFFVHPMKMGGWEKSVGKAMAQKGFARCKESI